MLKMKGSKKQQKERGERERTRVDVDIEVGVDPPQQTNTISKRFPTYSKASKREKNVKKPTEI